MLMLAGAAQSVVNHPGPIVKSPSDNRDYRAITLDNGLKAMLISDPTAVAASAAVDVHVGAFHDPEDRPGLAHFCEHMLFLSTKAYPVENEYFKFLSQHGGHANAYTASTHTNFFFEIQPDQLEPTLDRFAQFFIAPIFSEDAVDRELHAVASEHSKNLQNDAWRKRQLLKSFANPAHPYHKFSTGSVETLLPNNSSAKVLREKLVAWYNRSYSAPLMALTISGKQNLSTLQQWAVSKFSAVPRRAGVAVPDYSKLPRPYADHELPRAYDFKPVRQEQSLTLQWPLQGLMTKDNLAEKPLKTLGFLLGGEAKGSLLALLIEKGWAEGLVAGAGDAEDDYSIFEVRVACTPLGMDKWAEVVSHVFGAIRAMKKGIGNAAEAARIGKMVRHVDELNFDYKEEEEASGYTSDLAGNLHQYEAADALRGPAVTSGFNATRLAGLLARMTPQRLLLLRADFARNLTKVQKEKWYGTEYAELALPAGSLEEWSYPGVPSDGGLTLPEENAFLPSDFKLLAQPARAAASAAAGAAEPPQLLFNRSSGTLWHRTETSFGLPMATMQISWAVPRVGRSARGAVLAQVKP